MSVKKCLLYLIQGHLYNSNKSISILASTYMDYNIKRTIQIIVIIIVIV